MMSLASCSADGNDPVENSVSTYLLEKTYGARSVTYKENNYKKAIEIQYSDIAEEELQQRHNDYYYQGIDDIRIIWLSYDENWYIKNKTLSLLDKILNFQRIIPLIDGEKVYIIKKEKTIKVTTINENNYLITTKTIAFDLFNSLQWVNHLNNLLKQNKIKLYQTMGH